MAEFKLALVLGAGGFIGSHMVKRLKSEKYWVRGVDLKMPEFEESLADEFILADLRNPNLMQQIIDVDGNAFDEVYQYAADMGGAGFIFSGANDAEIMSNSAQININLLNAQTNLNEQHNYNKTLIFYSSSACVYPSPKASDISHFVCEEESAYPASPDSEYGWEKLFSERLYLTFKRNKFIKVKIARFHNIFGPLGTWQGGKEKAPAAICRKIAQAEDDGIIEIWGDGMQTRSFLYIDECIEATRRFMKCKGFDGPVNIGSEEMVSINELVDITAKIAGKKINIIHVEGPQGARGRNSSNSLLRKNLQWDYNLSLAQGIELTYKWISQQVMNDHTQKCN